MVDLPNSWSPRMVLLVSWLSSCAAWWSMCELEWLKLEQISMHVLKECSTHHLGHTGTHPIQSKCLSPRLYVSARQKQHWGWFLECLDYKQSKATCEWEMKIWSNIDNQSLINIMIYFCWRSTTTRHTLSFKTDTAPTDANVFHAKAMVILCEQSQLYIASLSRGITKSITE